MSDDDSSRTAEVLRLRYAEDLSIRAIGRKLNMARKTVRAVLGQPLSMCSTT
jgi:DNA-directed RNA polymerase specialized sigma24 family protein